MAALPEGEGQSRIPEYARMTTGVFYRVANETAVVKHLEK
jgi:hypothetical protein